MNHFLFGYFTDMEIHQMDCLHRNIFAFDEMALYNGKMAWAKVADSPSQQGAVEPLLPSKRHRCWLHPARSGCTSLRQRGVPSSWALLGQPQIPWFEEVSVPIVSEVNH